MTSANRSEGSDARHGRRSSLLVVVAIALVGMVAALVPIVTSPAEAADSFSCSTAFQIDETLSSGGRWQMCWELRSLAGVVLHQVTYTPPGGAPVEVLASMNLSQIHVPYDDNLARFHDVSDYGLGGEHIIDLQAAECPEGDLAAVGGVHVLCQQVRESGYAYKSFGAQARQSTLSLFSVSAVGAYNYVVAWNFDADGTIRPEIGATGQLQRFGGGPTTGWNLGEGARYAVAHTHNYYWRLDFDIAGADSDQVQELAGQASGDRQTFATTRSSFTSEVGRRVLPGAFRSWRIRDKTANNADGHRISYELLPSVTSIFRGPSYEPFTQNQFYATVNHECEQFASHNPTLNGACAPDVVGFTNHESLNGADVVVWYGTAFHHLPRDEDETHMGVHWSGFTIAPRDLTATNPIP